MKRFPHTPPWAPAIAAASTLASAATLAVAVVLPAALPCTQPCADAGFLATRGAQRTAVTVTLDRIDAVAARLPKRV